VNWRKEEVEIKNYLLNKSSDYRLIEFKSPNQARDPVAPYCDFDWLLASPEINLSL
jgi:hypothetical protein